nr:GNAT family N-acetyltransferase [Neptunicella marina]
MQDGQIISLLNAHLREMHKYSPAESVHALGHQSLRDPAITFWAARINNQLAACGAIKQLSSTAAEIKSMKTHPDYLRQGIAEKILIKIIEEAQRRDYCSLYLETGSHEAFIPAIKLYKKYGFTDCEPFADYKPDPYSLFMCKTL